MKYSRILLPLTLGLALSHAASGQVYESRDAEGNAVFSDEPSQGAEVVDLQQTNTAEPVAEPPPAPQPSQAPGQSVTGPATAAPQANENDDVYYGGDAVNQDEARRRREEVERQRAEGVNEPGMESPVDAEPRHNEPHPATGGVKR